MMLDLTTIMSTINKDIAKILYNLFRVRKTWIIVDVETEKLFLRRHRKNLLDM